MASTLEITLPLLGRKCEICWPGQNLRTLMFCLLWLHRQRLCASQDDKSSLGRTEYPSWEGYRRKRGEPTKNPFFFWLWFWLWPLVLSSFFCWYDFYFHGVLDRRARERRRYTVPQEASLLLIAFTKHHVSWTFVAETKSLNNLREEEFI